MNKDNEPRRSVLSVIVANPGWSAAVVAALSLPVTAAALVLPRIWVAMVALKVLCLFLLTNLIAWTVIFEALLVSIHRGQHRPNPVGRYGNTSLAMVLCGVAVCVCVVCAVYAAVPAAAASDSVSAVLAWLTGAVAALVTVLVLVHVAGSDDGGA